MKKLFLLGLILILIGLVIEKQDSLISIFNTYINPKQAVNIGQKNEYYRDYNFLYVKNTDNFSPNSKEDIMNIFYTAINAGKNSFTFYCPKEYKMCLNDVKDLANNQDQLSDINNFVHPFNGFSHIETEYDTLGRVTINIMKSYNKNDILMINNQVDSLFGKLVNPSLPLEDNIKAIHDYIINNTKYDSLRAENNTKNYKSDIAYGPIFQGYALCGGYTDLMQLFLEKLDVKSFKVSSNSHVWNAVYINDKWYHLDLTWDDPVSDDGRDYLDDSYFLIDTKKLLELDVTQHVFDQNVYQELKEA